MKLFIIGLLLLSININVFSQEFDWAITMNGESSFGLTDVAIDSDGNIITMGKVDFDGIVDFDPGDDLYEVDLTDQAGYIQKLDSAGNFLWVISTDFEGGKLETDHDGNIYIVGYLGGDIPIDFDPGPEENILIGNEDSGRHYLLKLDSDANFEWVQLAGIGGGWGDWLLVRDLSVGLDGVSISGEFRAPFDIDPSDDGVLIIYPTSDPEEGDNVDSYIRKVGFDGEFLWGATFNTYRGLIELETDTEGNLIVSSRFKGEIDLDPTDGEYLITSDNTGENSSVFILKLDEMGNFVWGSYWEEYYSFSSLSIATDPIGNIYLGGLFSGERDLDPGIGEEIFDAVNSMHVTKLDSDGNFNWTNINTNTGIESIINLNTTSLSVDTAGHTYLSGVYRGDIGFDIAAGPEVFEVEIPEDRDSFIMHIDENGDFVEALTLNGLDIQEIKSLICSPLGFMVTVGVYKTETDFDMGLDEEIRDADETSVFISRLNYECYDYSNVTTTTVTSCDEYVWELNDNTYESTGIYKMRFKDVTGCDSIQVLDYERSVDSIIVINTTECNSYYWEESGEEYTESGIYGVSHTNVHGCDSVRLIDLTIVSIDLTMARDELQLQATSSDADSYQWGKCTDAGFEPIFGKIFREYNVTENGDYAVEVAKDGCIGLSECITIGDVGVELIQLNQLIKVYPNPTQGEFRVDLGETTDQIEVTVCTVLGEEIQTLNNDKGNLLDITLTGAKGIYILQILSQNGLVDQIRIIKN